MSEKESLEKPKPSGISRRSFLAWTGFSACALTLGDGLWLEPRAVRVETLQLPLAKIPPGRQLRLVHLSDLHIRRLHGYYHRVAAMVADLEPDAIFITGDFLERRRNLSAVFDFLAMLAAPHGIFAVQGNWEYWARVEGESLRHSFDRRGTSLLINDRSDLEIRGVPLSVLGLDYPSSADALVKLQNSADPARLNLLLSHVPAFDHDRLDGRIDLMLAGHTHGGQVRLPLVHPFYLPRFSDPFVSGLYHVGPQTPLYVSRGVGTSLFPVRFLCPPEVTLFELYSAAL